MSTFHKYRGTIQMITGSGISGVSVEACFTCSIVSGVEVGARASVCQRWTWAVTLSTSPAVLPVVAWGLEDAQAGGF